MSKRKEELTGEQLYDSSKTWGTVIKGLRERGEVMLHAACTDLRDIEFTAEGINVYCREPSTFALLTKHKKTFDELAGIDVVNIISVDRDTNTRETIEHLKQLFGDKLKVI